MGREDDALARRAAREARRAAMHARDPDVDDVPNEDGGNGSSVEAIRAAREAARAAAVGAAVGAVRALTSRRDDDPGEEEDEALPQDGEAEDESAPPPQEEEEAEAPAPARSKRPAQRPREGAELGQVERAVRAAREQLRQLSCTEPESISGFERTADGWRVTLEVLELRRIPDTTDVLASYAVELDEDGNLLSYGRIRRYQRSEALDGSPS